MTPVGGTALTTLWFAVPGLLQQPSFKGRHDGQLCPEYLSPILSVLLHFFNHGDLEACYTRFHRHARCYRSPSYRLVLRAAIQVCLLSKGITFRLRRQV
jgi:hypothetical protein